jgi:hypothetical protein
VAGQQHATVLEDRCLRVQPHDLIGALRWLVGLDC